MFYTRNQGHGLAHDPIKAIVAPRPIAWVGTRGAHGDNLAAYSFFNLVASDMLAFSVAPDFRAEGIKDTLSNIRETNVFSVSIPSANQLDQVAKSGALTPSNIDEFDWAQIEKAECKTINAPFAAKAPAALECQLFQEVDLGQYKLIIGQIQAVHIDDQFVSNGFYDTKSANPISRLGYFDYAELGEITEKKTPKYP